MEKPQLTVARRSVGEWLSSLPTLFILLTVIFLSSGQIIHSQLLKIGENTWDEYFLLRGAGMVSEPTCNPDPDINQRVREIVEQRKAEAANDPLGDILGGSSVDEDAIRNSLESSRENCRNKWDRFKIVEEKVTPAVIAWLPSGVLLLVTMLALNRVR